jgi:hypothetical protein
LDWHWRGDIYTGIQRLTSLLGKLSNFSDQLNEILKSMSRRCNAVTGNNNKNPKQEKS